jgi:hypothetical protein
MSSMQRVCVVEGCETVIGEGCECEFDSLLMSRLSGVRSFDGSCCVCAYEEGKFPSFFNYACDNCHLYMCDHNIGITPATDNHKETKVEMQEEFDNKSLKEIVMPSYQGNLTADENTPNILFIFTSMGTHSGDPSHGTSVYVGKADIFAGKLELYHALSMYAVSKGGHLMMTWNMKQNAPLSVFENMFVDIDMHCREARENRATFMQKASSDFKQLVEDIRQANMTDRITESKNGIPVLQNVTWLFNVSVE